MKKLILFFLLSTTFSTAAYAEDSVRIKNIWQLKASLNRLVDTTRPIEDYVKNNWQKLPIEGELYEIQAAPRYMALVKLADIACDNINIVQGPRSIEKIYNFILNRAPTANELAAANNLKLPENQKNHVVCVKLISSLEFLKRGP